MKREFVIEVISKQREHVWVLMSWPEGLFMCGEGTHLHTLLTRASPHNQYQFYEHERDETLTERPQLARITYAAC